MLHAGWKLALSDTFFTQIARLGKCRHEDPVIRFALKSSVSLEFKGTHLGHYDAIFPLCKIQLIATGDFAGVTAGTILIIYKNALHGLPS
jgi:hypothetical protein